tara:strand:+ start:1869 stop:2114 length:246 start_codon:yes stop_codon:yes gene_type:complete
MALGRTAKYYREHPEARVKHNASSKKAAAKPAAIQKRVEANKARKDLGLKKGDKRDASHKNGTIVAEDRKINRARGGALKR